MLMLARSDNSRLLYFFGVLYAAEGLCQFYGLIHQPLLLFLKQEHGWSSTQISSFASVLGLPWILKPIFGAFSDIAPIYQHRRKPYLLSGAGLSIAAYAVIAISEEPAAIFGALLFVAIGMALCSTVGGGLLVEAGQEYGNTGLLVGQQWLWFNIAAIVAAFGGGWLSERLSPPEALYWAAVFLLFPPLTVALGAPSLIREHRVEFSWLEIHNTLSRLRLALRSRQIWMVALFLFLFLCSPGFDTPLYFHLTDHVGFSQQFIGILGSIRSLGSVAGALIFATVLGRFGTRRILLLAIAFGMITDLSYLLLVGNSSAVTIYFAAGISRTLTVAAAATLAANTCPPRSEAFSYAILGSVENLSFQLSDLSGSALYDHVLERHFAPLVIISAGLTALTCLILPLLNLRRR